MIDSESAAARIPHKIRHSLGPNGNANEGLLLIALDSVRSDRALCEQLDYNLLFRWFLDMSLDEPGLLQSNFSRLRKRLVETDVAQRFFDEVVKMARRASLLSDEHSTVDGTLIGAWATLKSIRPKDGPPPSGGDGSGMVDFKRERRTDATHESSTDPEAKLMRKGNGQPAKLSYGGHALMDNRFGLCVDRAVSDSRTHETVVAREMLARQRRKHRHPRTLGADKGYCTRGFIEHLREQGIAPHIARIEGRRTPGRDARTTRHESYRQSQRKRVEEIFGRLKTVGGLRKSRFTGMAKTQLYAYFAATAYNLLRIGRLTTT